MLPKLHKRYSKEQVVLGSIVNDYCELTNDGQIFLDKDTASSHILNTDLFKGKSAIWQSHFGYLTLSKDAQVSGGWEYA